MATILAIAPANLAKQNSLLAALPAADFERIAPHLSRLAMPLGEMLYEPGSTLRRVYFPTTAVVSLHYVLESGASAESAGVGFEGIVGISLFMGGETTPSSAAVQIAGHGYSLDAALLKQEFSRSAAVQILLLRYTQALIAQMTQTAACNRLHEVHQRLARWLLMTRDRFSSDSLPLTQDFLSQMIGTRRASVTVCAGILQEARLISYRRGIVTILNRRGLEESACDCYRLLQQQTEEWQRQLE